MISRLVSLHYVFGLFVGLAFGYVGWVVPQGTLKWVLAAALGAVAIARSRFQDAACREVEAKIRKQTQSATEKALEKCIRGKIAAIHQSRLGA